jgi:hypothetical protein
MAAETEFDILARLLQIQGDHLTPEGARFVLSIHFTQEDHKRIGDLGAKANTGKLTPEERAQFERYIRVDNVLSTMKSKARLHLKTVGQTA